MENQNTTDDKTVAEAQRRQVTVLFADIADFTPLAERLGEEASFRLVQKISAELMSAVNRHNGTVQEFTGDGVMALFGAPVALEDAPLRACRAALEMQRRMVELEDELQSDFAARPKIRIGIHAGPLVVGEVGDNQSRQFSVIGDTVNMASRLETAAAPGTVYVSAALQALVDGQVEIHDLGEYSLKGKSEPQRLYRLNSLKAGISRFDAARRRGLSSMVERGSDLEVLRQCWERAQAGGIHVAHIIGEAGIGKSRLMHEFHQLLSGDNLFVLRGDCSADGATAAFLPFIEVVRTSFGIFAGDDRTAIEQKLKGGMEVLGLKVADALPYLMSLLGQEPGDPDFAAQGTDLIGLRTRATLLDLLWQRCRMTPVVMLIEDLHWIDSASEQLLQQIVEADQDVALLVVGAYRPEYSPPWSSGDNVTEVALKHLTQDGTRKLLSNRLGTADLADELVRLVVEKAEGNPMFAEEIANYLQERHLGGTARFTTFDDVVLPTNLQNLLMERFDRLDEQSRSLLQAAAVIGRKFSTAIVGKIAPLDGTMSECLADLERMDLVSHIQDPYADYAFKHALVRDAIYSTLMTSQQRAMHRRVGDAMEQVYEGRLEEIADALAHHYNHTDRRDKAIRYLTMAGRKSLQLFSLEEADRRFARAAELFESGENEEGDVNIADILTGWLETMYWRSEFARTIEVVHPRLSAIKNLGNIPQVSWVLSWLGYAYTQMGHGEEADCYLHQALAIAEDCSDEEAIAQSCIGLMNIHNMRPGDAPAEYVAPLADRVMLIARKYGNLYLWTQCRVVHAMDNGMRGNFDEALRKCIDLVELGRREGYGGAIAFGLFGISLVQVYSKRFEEAIQNADDGAKAAVGDLDRLSSLSTKGTAMILAGQVSAGLELVRDVRRQITEIGYLAVLTVTEVPIGVAMVLSGDLTAGVRWLEAAITTASQSGNAYASAYAHLALGQIYAQIATGNDTPSLRVVLKNLIFLVRTVPFGKAKALRHFEAAIGISQKFALQGIEAQALMHMGLLHKAKKNLPEARRHLEEARAVAATIKWQFINDKIAAEIKAIE